MIVVISGIGHNLASVANALKRLNCDFVISTNPSVIANADKIILPGVGSADKAIATLHKLDLVNTIRSLTKPFLGICLGLQLLFEFSEEGNVDCLNIIPGGVRKFIAQDQLAVPHTGWNNICKIATSSLFNGIADQTYFYFTHSFYVMKNQHTLATSSHGHLFSAIVQKDNFLGMQFHPEKSGKFGLKLLENFLRLS